MDKMEYYVGHKVIKDRGIISEKKETNKLTQNFYSTTTLVILDSI